MIKAARIAAPLIAVLVVAGAAPARASAAVVVSGPASSAAGFYTPVVVASTAAPLTQVNLDNGAPHNVESVQRGPDSNPWCKSENFPKGSCPLFWSPLIRFGGSAPVQGVEKLAPGTYAFVCVLHGAMKGTLVVA